MRATSKQLHSVCSHHLNSKYLLSLNQTRSQNMLKSQDDIEKNTKLIPTMYLNVTDAESSEYLLHYHGNCSCPIIRGFDQSSKLPFLSILMHHTERSTWKVKRVLLICVFDHDRFDSVLIFHHKGHHDITHCFDIHALDSLLSHRFVYVAVMEEEYRFPVSDTQILAERVCYDCLLPCMYHVTCISLILVAELACTLLLLELVNNF